jgi:hypothetical protein
MGEIADDMVDGSCCTMCTMYFTKSHGYPVLCGECYASMSKQDRAGIPRAIYPRVDQNPERRK